MSHPDNRWAPTDNLAMVRELAAEIEEFRAARPLPSDEQFLARVNELLRTERDPEVHDAIWCFKEGSLDRSALQRHPAFARATVRRVTEAIDGLTPGESTELHEMVAEWHDERSELPGRD